GSRTRRRSSSGASTQADGEGCRLAATRSEASPALRARGEGGPQGPAGGSSASTKHPFSRSTSDAGLHARCLLVDGDTCWGQLRPGHPPVRNLRIRNGAGRKLVRRDRALLQLLGPDTVLFEL